VELPCPAKCLSDRDCTTCPNNRIYCITGACTAK
jgi:hypothetical protein